MRKLAEQSHDATKQISTLITDIQNETTKAVQAMNNGTQEVKKGTQVVNNAGQSFRKITQAIEKISLSSQSLAKMAEELQSAVYQFKM